MINRFQILTEDDRILTVYVHRDGFGPEFTLITEEGDLVEEIITDFYRIRHSPDRVVSAFKIGDCKDVA